jgi:biopolymer transport protein ExbB
VVIERVLFLAAESRKRSRDTVNAMLGEVARGSPDSARQAGESSGDFVARVLAYALAHRDEALPAAVLHASSEELERFDRGLTVLDTIVTLAPLLGLLGTVTGMIRTFGLLGGTELGAPQAVTGGIAEALIATAFGLGIAIVALIPLNALNARLEKARREIEAAATQLELLLK